MADVASLIREARLPERRVPICLRTDLSVPYEALAAKLAQIKKAKASTDSFGGGEDPTPITDEMAALAEQMRSSTVDFTLRALSRPRFRNLVAEHPPRKDDDGKVVSTDWNGVNTATFYNILIRETTIDPVLDEATWTTLLEEKLTDRQFNDLAESAWDLCRDKVDLPFLSTG